MVVAVVEQMTRRFLPVSDGFSSRPHVGIGLAPQQVVEHDVRVRTAPSSVLHLKVTTIVALVLVGAGEQAAQRTHARRDLDVGVVCHRYERKSETSSIWTCRIRPSGLALAMSLSSSRRRSFVFTRDLLTYNLTHTIRQRASGRKRHTRSRGYS